MNVVIATDFAHINGGASKVALSSARALALRGHRVIVLAGVGPVDPSLLDLGNLTVECLGQHDILANPNRLAAVTQGIWNAEAQRSMHRILGTLPAADTVVHVHMWGKSLSSSIVRAAADRGFPTLLTLHDFLAVCPTGTLFQHGTQSICPLRPMSLRCVASNCDARNYGHKLWRVTRQLAQRGPGRLPSGLTGLIAISTVCRQVMERYLPPGAPLFLVENPVEVEQLPPPKPSADAKFVFVGRLAAEKGPVLFARAASLAGVEAVFVGDGELRREILDANPNATITGWQSGDRAQHLLRGARALVFPSLWLETQGLVVAEALAMGIPSIVSDTTAAAHLIEDRVSGLLFRNGDAEDLAAKLSFLATRPDEALRMGHAAYTRFWRSPPTLDAHAQALEALYTAVAGERATAAHPIQSSSAVLN